MTRRVDDVVLATVLSIRQQTRAFGLLAEFAPAEVSLENVLNRDVLPRFRLLSALSALMEKIGHRDTFSDEPVIYNLGEWPRGGAPAGWIRSCPGVSVQTAIESHFFLWNLQLEPEGEGAVAQKVLRAALWVLRKHSFLEAVRYVLDLEHWGLILRMRSTFFVLTALMDARRATKLDTSIPGMLVERPTDDPDEWCRIALREPPPDTVRVRTITDDVDLLVQRCEERIDAVRASEAWDEWLLGQAEMRRICELTQAMLRRLGLADSLGYRSFYARIEEIRADAGAFVRSMRLWRESFQTSALGASWWAPDAMIRMLAEHEDWRERAFVDRLLVPTRLERHFDGREPDRARLAREWQRLSPMLAPIVSSLLLDQDDCTRDRARPFTKGELVAADSPALQSLADAVLIDAACELLSTDEPKNSGVRTKPEAAGALESGDVLATLERLFSEELAFIGLQGVPKAAADRLMADGSFDSESLAHFCFDAYTQLCAAELVRFLEELVECVADENRSRRKFLLDKILSLYPYASPALWERCVSRSEEGDLPGALQDISAAILLQPENGHLWHSLAVVARRMGQTLPSNVALAVSAMILQTEDP